jgi:hypothetical protein
VGIALQVRPAGLPNATAHATSSDLVERFGVVALDRAAVETDDRHPALQKLIAFVTRRGRLRRTILVDLHDGLRRFSKQSGSENSHFAMTRINRWAPSARAAPGLATRLCRRCRARDRRDGRRPLAAHEFRASEFGEPDVSSRRKGSR